MMTYKEAVSLAKHASSDAESAAQREAAELTQALRLWADTALTRSETAYNRYMKGKAAAQHSKNLSRALLAALAITGGAAGQALPNTTGAKILASLAGAGVGGFGGYWLGRGLAHMDNDNTAKFLAYKAATKPVNIRVNTYDHD